MPRPIIGSKNGRLTILSFLSNGAHPLARVQCDCGTIKNIQIHNLARTHSCGCIKRELLAAKATHGMSGTMVYRRWADMIDRCTRMRDDAFRNYGGRGITVCERWRQSFADFYADMGEPPTRKHSIDRIDNDGNYELGNCRWATKKTQRVNQRRVAILAFRGVTGTLKDLAAHFGISYSAAHQRRYTMHWPLEKILTMPQQSRKRRS